MSQRDICEIFKILREFAKYMITEKLVKGLNSLKYAVLMLLKAYFSRLGRLTVLLPL
jgi:hypothetical protein